MNDSDLLKQFKEETNHKELIVDFIEYRDWLEKLAIKKHTENTQLKERVKELEKLELNVEFNFDRKSACCNAVIIHTKHNPLCSQCKTELS